MTKRDGISVFIGGGDAGERGDADERPDPDSPFRILVLADLSGRASRSVREPLAGRKPFRVDRDEAEETLARLRARVRVTAAGREEDVRIDSLEAFHPDRLLTSLDATSPLLDLRRRLRAPGTAREAAVEARALLGLDESTAPASTSPSSAAAAPESASLLDAILGVGSSSTAPPPAARPLAPIADPSLASFVRGLVPETGISREGGEAALVAAIEAVASATLRNVLHHASFQGVEAAWRGVDFLLRRLETDGPLELYALDVSPAELAADLSEGPSRSALARTLLEDGPEEGRCWAAVVLLPVLEATLADVALLVRLSQLAEALDAPVLAGAAASLARCRSFGETPDPDDWSHVADEKALALFESFRGLPTASRVGLVLPRLLLRVPYGKAGETCERLDFEEHAGEPPHEDYLWGSGALAAALLLGLAFQESGWDLRLAGGDVPGLPLAVRREGGQTIVTPVAEANLTVRAYEGLLEQGFMPLLTMKGRDSARLSSFQALSGGELRSSRFGGGSS